MKHIIWVLLLPLIALTTLAQDKSTEIPTLPVSINTVTSSYDPDSGLKLTINITQSDGCLTPLNVTQERGDAPNILVLEVTRDAPDGTMMCTEALIDRDVEVMVDPELLEETLSDEFYAQHYLIINDEAYFSLPYEGADTRTVGAAVAYQRQDAEINSVEIQQDSRTGNYIATVEGMQLQGCPDPIVTHQQVEEGNILSISIFQLLPPDVKCPETFIAPVVNARVLIKQPENAPLDGDYLVKVNNFELNYTFEGTVTGKNTISQLAQFDTAEVIIMESAPPQVQVVIKGFHPDGCDFPMRSELSKSDTIISIKVYREVDPAVMCTMMMQSYEFTVDLGAIEPGTYTIHINGKTVEASIQ